MQPDSVAQLPAACLRDRVDARELVGDRVGRLAPGEVDVGVRSRDLERGRRRAAEVQLRPDRIGDDLGAVELIVPAVEVHGLALPQRSEDLQVLAAAVVALLLAQVIAETALLGVIAAGDDVEQQPTTGDALEGRGHLRGERRGRQTGTQRDEEPEPLGHLAQRGRHDPTVLAPAARRTQRGIEAQLLGRPRDLADVPDVRGPLGGAVAHPAALGADGVAEAEVRA